MTWRSTLPRILLFLPSSPQLLVVPFYDFGQVMPKGRCLLLHLALKRLRETLVLASGAGIYRTQRQSAPAQYPGLRVLLDELLRRGMDPSWHRFIFVLCAHVAGMNFRNELSHGFVDDVSDGTAAVLLQAAAHLAMLGPASVKFRSKTHIVP